MWVDYTITICLYLVGAIMIAGVMMMAREAIHGLLETHDTGELFLLALAVLFFLFTIMLYLIGYKEVPGMFWPWG